VVVQKAASTFFAPRRFLLKQNQSGRSGVKRKKDNSPLHTSYTYRLERKIIFRAQFLSYQVDISWHSTLPNPSQCHRIKCLANLNPKHIFPIYSMNTVDSCTVDFKLLSFGSGLFGSQLVIRDKDGSKPCSTLRVCPGPLRSIFRFDV